MTAESRSGRRRWALGPADRRAWAPTVLSAWFEPYERSSATRWLRTALLVFATVPLLSAPWGRPSVAVLAVPVLISLLCAATAAAAVRHWQPGPRAWACVLLVSNVLVVASDLATRDAGAIGLTAFLVPAVLAAALLRPGGAWTVAASSAAGSLVTCWLVLPVTAALPTWAGASATLVLLTALLSNAADRNHRLTAELRRQAAVDSLTGLLTRRVLDEALAVALSSTTASRGSGLLVVDLDHFKRVNDTHGHLTGDAALRHASAVLTRVAGPTAVVSRLGGDELAVLLPDTSHQEVAALAEAVADAVRTSPLHLDGVGRVPLTVSVGAAHSSDRTTSSHDLYRAADEALYTAKRAGRDRSRTVTCCSPLVASSPEAAVERPADRRTAAAARSAVTR